MDPSHDLTKFLVVEITGLTTQIKNKDLNDCIHYFLPLDLENI